MGDFNFIRTDLADEGPFSGEKNYNGISVSDKQFGDISVSTIKVLDETGEKSVGKPIGKYVTVSFGKLWLKEENEFRKVVSALSEQIRCIAKENVGEKEYPKVLIAGLGNRYITPDAIGPQCIKGITVTRHIRERNEKLFSQLKKWDISAISPGVTGQTGIETEELIKSACSNVMPDLLLVIDALASRSVDRLATTVQLSDTGICPGSGIGNKCRAINRSSLGIPVIAVGVPTMVDSSTLVCDALEKAGINSYSPELKKVLENGRSFFVTLNESDVVISTLSRLLSEAVNAAFSFSEPSA